MLSILGAGDPSVLLSHAYDAEDLVLPLALTPAAETSRLLCASCLNPPAARAVLTTQNVTVNLHHDGVPPSAFAPGTALSAAFTVLSTNVDLQGKAFVSTMEAKVLFSLASPSLKPHTHRASSVPWILVPVDPCALCSCIPLQSLLDVCAVCLLDAPCAAGGGANLGRPVAPRAAPV